MVPLADLLLYNAKVFTMDPARPQASVVAVRGGRIAAVGEAGDLEALRGPDTRLLDAEGRTVTPALLDPHLHLLAWAARLSSVDCSPGAVASIPELQRAIAGRARTLPPGSWVRAAGYDEFALREKRHPTRHDLDAAAPQHPVKLGHRSGHAWVLNSRGLELAGIRLDTPEPPGATIEREVPSGEPSGLLLEMDDYLGRHTPGPTPAEIEAGLRQVDRQLLSWGVTFVQDATPSNDLTAWRDLAGYLERDILRVNVSMMVGLAALPALRRAGLAFGSAEGRLVLGGVKIILSESSGRLYPAQKELEEQVEEAQGAGFQAALHAVGVEAVASAVAALERVRRLGPGHDLRHRLEHASVCSPELLGRIARAGLGVVTQPAFLYYSGDRFLETVDPEDLPWLYRSTSLWRQGVAVAASSDAPVAPGDPRAGLYGAMARKARSGRTVGEGEGLALEEALALFTRQAAYLTFQETERGVITPGKRADLVLWDRDLSALESPEELLQARALLTLLDGVPTYQA